jgi:hypothetical protein
VTLGALVRIGLGAALLCAACSPSVAAAAVGSSDDGADLTDLPIVPDQELAVDRGGFSWQGVEIGLGAEIRTYLDGALVLQTNISWTPSGAATTQVVSGALAPADAAQLQAGLLANSGISMRVGDQSVYLANGGQTAIFQPTDGAIQNVLVNRANNISARQEVDATLDLHNFGQFQQQVGQSRMGDAIGEALNLGTLGAIGH